MSDPQVQETPEQLAELGAVLLDLAKSKQKAGASAQDLSLYTAAAILYQHVLSICEQNKDVIDNSQAKALADTACQELAQIEQSMLGQATGAEAITPKEPLPARIAKDKAASEEIRQEARQEAASLSKLRDKQGSAEEVRYAEVEYISSRIFL